MNGNGHDDQEEELEQIQVIIIIKTIKISNGKQLFNLPKIILNSIQRMSRKTNIPIEGKESVHLP